MSDPTASEERYMSDHQIEAQYTGFAVLEARCDTPNISGGMHISFPNGAEDRWENFLVCQNGSVSFDSWFPQPVYEALSVLARSIVAGNLTIRYDPTAHDTWLEMTYGSESVR